MPANIKMWKHFLSDRAHLRDYIRKLVANHADVADLLQEVGLVILHREDVPSDALQFSAWCRGVARNLISHHWRSTRRRDELFSSDDTAGEAPDSGVRSTEDLMELRGRLMECLEELDDQSRVLLTMRYMDGQTSREIARQFRQSPAAIRMRIMRVRETLKGRMKQ